MKDYPTTDEEFKERFNSEEQCGDYILKLRYTDGIYKCPVCGSKESWLARKTTYECAHCHHQKSILSGTIFQDTHKPLTLWFRAMWHFASQNAEINVLGLQKRLNIGTYKTAWTMMHKIRRAMFEHDKEKLSGNVYLNWDLLEHPRNANIILSEDKVIFAIEVIEIVDKDIHFGRFRMYNNRPPFRENLLKFVHTFIEPGAIIITEDDWDGYNKLENEGFHHKIVKLNLWHTFLLGKHSDIRDFYKFSRNFSHGKHGLYYDDEYVFRWKGKKSQGKRFYQLAYNAVHIEPVTYAKIVNK
jgi:transposase-like protein